MQLQILGFELRRLELRTRLPFRYGIATMTRVPHLFARLNVTVDGRETCGVAADLLPPKWFTKNPATPLEDEIFAMLRVIQHAFTLAVGMRGRNVFALWRDLHAAQSAWGTEAKLPPLLVHFGTSLVERALIEAVGRATGSTFAGMLRANLLGLELGEIHSALKQAAPADFLPSVPLPKVIARHTVGLADPLTDDDIPPAERLDDGLPQSLVACIRAYGLRHFKIKILGDPPRDTGRLARLAALLRQHAPPDFAFTLDGNEQFTSFDQFREFWESVTSRAELRDFFRHLLFVEQPLHRDAALEPEAGEALRQWSARPPLIIDESDATPADLPRALRLGYAGTSHKNCKGILKGVAHACLLTRLQREEPARRFVMSGEDLCNVGPVALLQDLAVMAALGIRSVERNGHHYHAGLSQFPPAVQRQALAHHPDLYQPGEHGWPTLCITGGEIELGTVNRAPLGVGFEADLSECASVGEAGA